MLTVKVVYEDGDYMITRINATEQEARDYYRVGSVVNVGDGPRDYYTRIASVEVL